MNDHPLDPLLDATPGGTPRPQEPARPPRRAPRSHEPTPDSAPSFEPEPWSEQARSGQDVPFDPDSTTSGAADRPPRERTRRTAGAGGGGGSSVSTWLPAVAAIGLLGVVVFAGLVLGGGGDGGDGGDTIVAEGAALAPVPDAPALTVPESVPDVTSEVEGEPEVEKVPLSRTLSKGLAGDDVARVQQRLTDLGFVPGPIDGIYGDQTIQAVWAYEKLVLDAPSNAPTGKVTPEMWDRMQDNFRINPRRPNSTPNHVEVYLPEQVVAVFHDDVPIMISHMSSGTGDEWCKEVRISPGEYGNRDGEEDLVRGECGVSNTPGGVFTVYRQVEGTRDTALGSMWDPVYFNYGIAIHGALNVPLQPASHGCIRVPLSISADMQGLIQNGDQVFVWDGEKEPEENGSPPPTFNWIDPDYETTTTTSTTTTPEATTTVAPATTQAPATAPATTQAPATTKAPTTTVAPATTKAPTTTVAPATTLASPSSGDTLDDG